MGTALRKLYVPYPPTLSSDFAEQAVFPDEHPALIFRHGRSSRSVPPHWHPGAEIVFVLEGRGSFVIDGRIHRLAPGKVLLISPYSIHQVTLEMGYEDTQQILSVTFDHRPVESAYPLSQYMQISWDAPQATREDRDRMRQALTELNLLVDQSAPEVTLKINALLYELLYLAYSRFTVGRRQQTARHDANAILPMMAFIDSSLHTRVTAQDVADRFGYSREHFCRFFSECTGMTFKSYVTLQRLEIAYSLLMYEGATLARCAEKSGFPSVRSMSTAFKQRYGQAPLAYREQTLAAEDAQLANRMRPGDQVQQTA